MKKKSTLRFWTALAVFSLMGQVAWVVENMYFNVFLYKMFHATPGQISAMVALSAVSATLTTVFMGALSDRIGKRKLFIWLGYVLWGISIFSFVFLKKSTLAALHPAAGAASLGVSLTILLDCVMTFFGSTANDAAFNAWLTDSVEEKRRGAAEGINAMMPLVAILAVFGGFMFFDLNLEESWTRIFLIIGALVLCVGLSGIFLLDEPKITPCREGYLSGIFYGFAPKTVKKNPTLYKHLFAFVLFNVAIQIFMPYLILYYEVSLNMKDYVLVMAPAIVLASVFTAFWGKVYDKKGFRFSGSIALSLLLCGFAVLYLFRGRMLVFLGSLSMMCGYLSGMAVFGAAIRRHTPRGSAGRFQGVRIFSQVLIPGIVGPWVGSLILSGAGVVENSDGTVSFIPNANIFLGAFLCALTLLPFFLFQKKKRETKRLTTPFESKGRGCFEEYPRPLMRRDSFFSLNGAWDFAVESKRGRQRLGRIRVPFPPESRLSGIEREIAPDETMIYRRRFSLPDAFCRDRILLHFGAADHFAQVFVNDKKVGEHRGGYLPFSFDVSDFIQNGENEICVKVTDAMDSAFPYGKQTANPGGMWYTKVSGIWQTVWMESVPKNAICNLTITPEIDCVTICVEGGEAKKRLILWEEGRAQEYTFGSDRITIPFAEPRNWTPEDPYLYRFTLFCGEDRVESYFALRTVSVETRNGVPLICLNGTPYFFHGLLDQGYYPDGIFLPATPEGYRQDILKMKSCGFNTLRKHIKLEPQLFYYECDRLGMIVFQDMINAGKYSFLRDTALPTLGIKKGIRHRVPEKTKTAFMETAMGIQDILHNHPCVLYYTVFNEGWGQFDADKCYRALKEKDPRRIYDATSGWFTEKESDVVSEHIYFKPLSFRPDGKRPLVLSEFGGYSYKEKGHVFNEKDTYGYRFFQKRDDFCTALSRLYENEVIPALESGLCATVLTQVSDVEDETNGLITYDRRVMKVNEGEMKALSDKTKRRFSELFRQ